MATTILIKQTYLFLQINECIFAKQLKYGFYEYSRFIEEGNGV